MVCVTSRAGPGLDDWLQLRRSPRLVPIHPAGLMSEEEGLDSDVSLSGLSFSFVPLLDAESQLHEFMSPR